MDTRPATEDDRDAVLALGVTEEVAWFGEADLSPEEVGEWIDDEGGLAGGVVAVGDDGEVCAFASPGRHAAVFLGDPARTDALVGELLPWLQTQSDELQLMTYAGDAARVAAFERHGLRHRRSTFSLARPESAGPVDEAEFPCGIEVAPYRLGGEEDEAVHRLVYVDAAWDAVPGHVARDLESWRESNRANPVSFLARRDGTPVGWVSGRILDSGRGYVHMLAVAQSERGRGLGRALLLHAFTELQRDGARGLTLGVEAENEKALGLYRSIGLEVEREWRYFAGGSPLLHSGFTTP